MWQQEEDFEELPADMELSLDVPEECDHCYCDPCQCDAYYDAGMDRVMFPDPDDEWFADA